MRREFWSVNLFSKRELKPILRRYVVRTRWVQICYRIMSSGVFW